MGWDYQIIRRERAIYVLKYLYCSFPIVQGGSGTALRVQFGGVI